MANGTNKKTVLGFVDKADNFEGFEQISTQTMAIPFVRIAQDSSPQLKKNNPGYIEELEAGDFFNTVSKVVYGKKLKAIVLKFERIYIEWLPNRGGFVGYHSVENAERIAADKTFGKWKTETGNILQENYVYFLLLDGHEKEGINVFSLYSSAIKSAREWNRLLTTHVLDNGKRALPYYLVWEITSEHIEKEPYDWYVPRMSFSGYINEKQYKIIGPERKALPERQVDYSQISDQTTESENEF
jgi:hypothetical protein